jgi:hypothetical protein
MNIYEKHMKFEFFNEVTNFFIFGTGIAIR